MELQSDQAYVSYLLNCVPELEGRFQDQFRALKALTAWLSERTTYSSQKLLIDHDDIPLHALFTKLSEKEGGVWCGGAAKLLTCTLRALGVTALYYDFGIRSFGLSHAITLVYSLNGSVNAYDLYTNSILCDPEGYPADFAAALADLIHNGQTNAAWRGSALRPALISKQEQLDKYSSYLVGEPTKETDAWWFFREANVNFDTIFPRGHVKRHQLDVLAAAWGLPGAGSAFMRLMVCGVYTGAQTAEGRLIEQVFQKTLEATWTKH